MILQVSLAKPNEYRCGNTEIKHHFETITGRPCLMVSYSRVTPEFMARYPIKAMFVEGFGYRWEEFDVPAARGLWEVLHSTDLPVYGACGGHQLLGFVFNKDFRKIKQLHDEPVRKLRPGEPDLYPTSYHPGYLTELGMYPLEIVQRDPLLAGVKKTFWVREAHYCEVKTLPPDFIVLAKNQNCAIQAMRHATRPIYGAQFHAELPCPPAYPDGEKITRNFFRIAGLVK